MNWLHAIGTGQKIHIYRKLLVQQLASLGFDLAKMVRAIFDGANPKLVIAIDVGTSLSSAVFWSVTTWILACSSQGKKSRYVESIGHEFIGP